MNRFCALSCVLTETSLDGNIRLGTGNRLSSRRSIPAGEAPLRAEVAELADALHSGCSTRQGVEVRVLSSAPIVFLSAYLQ